MRNTIRLDLRRLVKLFLLMLVLPVVGAFIIDLLFNLTPLLTIVSSVICIPLTSVVITKVTLAEFDKVIDQVAPKEPEVDTNSSDLFG